MDEVEHIDDHRVLHLAVVVQPDDMDRIIHPIEPPPVVKEHQIVVGVQDDEDQIVEVVEDDEPVESLDHVSGLHEPVDLVLEAPGSPEYFPLPESGDFRCVGPPDVIQAMPADDICRDPPVVHYPWTAIAESDESDVDDQ